MKSSRIAILLAILICTGSCEPTRYQRAGTTCAAGYSDKRFSEDTYHVKFVANYFTPTDTLCGYLYRRAAELTLRHGLRYFAVIREPRALSKYRIMYRSQEDREAWIDGMEVEVPAWGTLHMTIQCFKDAQDASDACLIDAKAYLRQNLKSKPE